MNLFDHTFASPAANLACDDALLEMAESGQIGEVLRFWESQAYFVVVGYSNKLAEEVNLQVCEARGIPVLRRCTGGGTVLQGPGCLNYTLILRIEPHSPTRNISAANQFIMEQNRQAVEGCLKDNPIRPIRVDACGHTDLAIQGRKFSGNSQRRRKNFLLFHGTFLLRFDLGLIGQLLNEPVKQPDYRERRPHDKFLMNLPCPPSRVKVALKRVWNADEQPFSIPTSQTEKLVAEKYATREWNRKF